MKSLLKIIQRNIDLIFTKNLSTKWKIKFLFNEVVSTLKILLGKKELKYFKHKIQFDNPTTIFSVLVYPDEILNKILRNIDIKVESVLDLGGNWGQFSITMSSLNQDLKRIDVFEPNQEIFKLLENNIKGSDLIKVYNYGIGEDQETKMYFTENRSGIGSMIKENASYQGKDVVETQIKLISDIPEHTGIKKYDLLKIDVEGFEFEAIKAIKNVETKYLFVELSGLGRKKSYSTIDMYRLIADKWGDFEIVHQTEFDCKSDTYDVLIKFL
jgi:FkbM family methyltransferase